MDSIGITLLLAKKLRKRYRAYLASYVLTFTSKSELVNKIEHLVEKYKWKHHSLVDKDEKGFIYFGIEDIFKVSGSISNKALLGRSSIMDINSYDEAVSLVHSKHYFLSNIDEVKDDYVVSLIYFYSDNKLPFSISGLFYFQNMFPKNVITLVENKSNNLEFIQKIINTTDEDEELNADNFQFCGIESLRRITDFSKSIGSYEVLSKDFDSLNAISKLLPNQQEILDSVPN